MKSVFTIANTITVKIATMQTVVVSVFFLLLTAALAAAMPASFRKVDDGKLQAAVVRFRLWLYIYLLQVGANCLPEL